MLTILNVSQNKQASYWWPCAHTLHISSNFYLLGQGNNSLFQHVLELFVYFCFL